MEENADPIKVLFVGDAGVGKTCLLNRLYGDDFAETNEDWDVKKTSLTFGNITKPILLTDTAGQERFRELTSASYKSVDIVFIVYSIDDKKSFENLTRWIGEVHRYATNKDVLIVIVSNKIDLDGRVVTTEEGQAFATSKGLQFLETSAKTNHNVSEITKIILAPRKPEKQGGGCCELQ